jgi:hypothetical protein
MSDKFSKLQARKRQKESSSSGSKSEQHILINDDVSAGRLNQSEADQNTSIKLPEDYNITNVNDETLGLPLNPSINIKNEKKHNGSVNSF